MKSFFISYNKNDRTWAEWIAWQLEEAGYTTVLQAWDFRPGLNFVLEMQQAATESDRTIAVLSPTYLDSLYTKPEWAAAFSKDPTGTKGSLIPVRVQECELTGLLSQIIYIDLTGLEEIEAKNTLLEGVRPGRIKPNQPPIFPGSLKRSVLHHPVFLGGPLDKSEDKINNAREKVRQWGQRMAQQRQWDWHLLGHALQFASEAIESNPINQHAWTLLADVYHRIGKSEIAKQCLIKSYELAAPGANHPGRFYKQVKGNIESGYPFNSIGGLQRESPPGWFEEKYKRYWNMKRNK